jgi:hypothetical protein
MPLKRSPGCKCCGGQASVSGQVRGCQGLGVANAIVTVNSGGTGGPFVCNSSGNYVGKVNLTKNGNVTLGAKAADPYSARFRTISSTFAAAIGSSYVINFQLQANTLGGYNCLPQALGCNYPISNTLKFTDPIFGALSFLYNKWAVNAWSVAFNPAYTGVSGCSSQPSIAIGHVLKVDGSGLATDWGVPGLGNDCPINSTANVLTSTMAYAEEVNTITVVSCMPLNLSIPINLGTGRRLQKVYGTGTQTITITE